MIKVVCDGCKKEISRVAYKCTRSDGYIRVLPEELDLCLECSEKLLEWPKEGEPTGK